MDSKTDMQIRRAEISDVEVIAEFNCGIARETEQIELLPDVIRAGVTALIKNPSYGFYVLAEVDRAVVGSLMITTEWSDWRNGMFWWVQSVYVRETHRRQGVYRAMYEHVRQLAKQNGGVCGFRLYVEHENHRAQQTYTALGMQQTPYRMFEDLQSSVRYCENS